MEVIAASKNAPLNLSMSLNCQGARSSRLPEIFDQKIIVNPM